MFVTARDKTKAKAAIDDILRSSTGKGKLEVLHLELDSLQSVRDFAAEFPKHSKQLNVLINNAGKSLGCPKACYAKYCRNMLLAGSLTCGQEMLLPDLHAHVGSVAIEASIHHAGYVWQFCRP